MSRIGLGIKDAQLKHIVGLTTAHEMWTVFEKIYSTVNVSSRNHLHRKFTQSKWTSGTMAEYIDQMQDLVFRIQRAGREVRDEEFVCHIIGTMPHSWETFISGQESSPPDMLTPDYVIQKLKSEYERHQDRKEASHIDATETTAMVNKPNRRAAAVVRTEKSLRTQTKAPRVDVNTCLDSGATKHMTNDRAFFSSFRKLESTMSNADGHRAKVAGIDSAIISYRLKSGEVKRLQLNDVLYVPTLLDNRLSVSRALKSDLVVHFENKLATVAIKRNDGSSQKMIEADLDEDEGLFRFRTLFKQDTARTAKIFCDDYNEVYECCIQEKLAAKFFPCSQSTTEKPLELIHIVKLLKQKDEVTSAVKDYAKELQLVTIRLLIVTRPSIRRKAAARRTPAGQGAAAQCALF
ncbi:integrase core domain protein [Lasius niger]|uniref:Integrase core domain protein n=1 Tax=Lasius niger TaxID=67767 RepID=A0A0J7K8T4_LASNI|nr:integrase core domain protein [Lasius niger]